MKKYILILAAFLWVHNVSASSPKVKLKITKVVDYPGKHGASQIEYEKIYGQFTGEVDPADTHNQIITDIALADKNANGMVEYSSDFFLIKPKDLKNANGILRYDAPNRGNAYGSRPDSVLMARGYIFLSAAWQGDVKKLDVPNSMFERLYLEVPTAHNLNGSEITGTVRVEFAPSKGTHPLQMDLCGNVYNSNHISYLPATFPGNEGCQLTMRRNENDPRRLIPNQDWSFASSDELSPFPGKPDPTKISIKGGFSAEYLYELIYTAKNPKVMGLGLAAVRDVVYFFRDKKTDSDGIPNPIAGCIKYTIGTGTSQSGNFMKTFLHLGFNESLSQTKVFDGLFPIVGARQNNINMRFAVPGGGGGPRTEHRAYGQSSVRGFADNYVDEISGKTGGILSRAVKSNTAPKVFMLLTSSEMWALQASPIFTDAYGQKDLTQPENVRIYYLAGAQHSVASYGSTWNPVQTMYPGFSAVDGAPIQRALWIALEQWIMNGNTPPVSQMPSIAAKTLVFPENLQFPEMKGVKFKTKNGLQIIPDFKYLNIINNLSLLDFGPQFNLHDETGIVTQLPPAYLGKDYAIMVSQIDADGNEIAGIRTVDLLAPLGTSLGFNYLTECGYDDLAGLTGGYIPFHKTKSERLNSGDTRLSLEERYTNKDGYVHAVEKAAQKLVEDHFLLQEDAAQIIKRAQQTLIFDK